MGFVEELREKYDSFTASLEEKGVPNPRILVPALAAIVVVALVYFLAVAPSMVPTKTVSLLVKNAVTGQPVSGASVTLYCADCPEGRQRVVEKTNGDGTVLFEKIPEKLVETLRVSVNAAGFQQVVSQPIPATGEILLSPEITQPRMKSIVVRVKDSLGNDVDGAQVLFFGDDGSAKIATTDSFGEAVLQVPEDRVPAHATITVEKQGFGKKQQSVSQTEFEQVIYVELTAIDEENKRDKSRETEGTLVVRAQDEEGKAVRDATISLVDYYTESVFREGKTLEDGTVAFDKIAFGKKFRILAKHRDYEAFSSTDYYLFAADSSVFVISLKKKTLPDPNALKVVVSDAEGNAVSGAEASVFDRATRTLLATAATDANGEAIVSVQKGRGLYLTVYAPGFLPAFDEYVQAGDVKKIVLDKEAAGNFVDVPVNARQDGEPAPNALVKLFQANGFPLGVPSQYTDADGTAVFRIPRRLKNTNYGVYATASLDDLRGKSDVVTVTEDAELFVNLAPEPALLVVQARDIVLNESIEGASVSLLVGGAQLASCETKKTGCNFTVAPETEFTLAATAAGYLRAETSAIILGAGERATVVVYLYPSALVKTASSRFQGFFDSRGKQVRELGNAEYYDARFLAIVPSSADETHFYASFGDRASAEEDIIVVTSFDANTASTVYSGTASGESCVAANESSSLEGFKKWVLFVLPKGFVGTKEIVLRVYVKPTARAGEKTHVYHRLSGVKKNVPFLAPADEALLNELLDKTRAGASLRAEDFCNAKLASETVSITRDPLLCDGSFCYKIVFKDAAGQRSRTGFVASLGKEFWLDFTVLSEVNEIVELGVQAGDALEFLGFEAGGVGVVNYSAGRKLLLQRERASEAKETRIALSAAPGEKASGTLRFKALRASAFASIALSFYFSDPSETPFALATSVRVSGTNLLRVSATPTEFVAGLKENVRVTIRDSLGAPVTDATLLFYECEGTPLNEQEIEVQGDGSRNNGEDGAYKIRWNPATIGTIGLRVSREGFKSFEECLFNVNAGEFIEVSPPIIKIEGDSRKPAALTKQITVTQLLSVKSRVSTSVACVAKEENASLEGVPIIVVPQSFTLKDSMAVEVIVKENVTAKADCFISFNARINERNSFVAVVMAQVNVFAPPTPNYCPIATQGFKCLAPSKATPNCVLMPQFVCLPALGLEAKCFACESGETTLPKAFELTVGLTKPTDTVLKEVFLDNAPDECRIEGFDANPAQMPSNYYNQFYATTPVDYWNYQTTPWNYNAYGYGISPWNMNYQPFNYLQGYNPYSPYSQTGYATGMASSVSGTHPYSHGYPSTSTAGTYAAGTYPTYPTYGYCPNYLNPQSMYGSYYGNYYANPWQQGFPNDYPLQCQYPWICQNPSLCSYATAGYAGMTGANFYSPIGSYGAAYGGASAYAYGGFNAYTQACQYPYVCSAPQACPYISSSYLNYQMPSFAGPLYGSQLPPYSSLNQYFNYRQSKPPVAVRVDSCTQFELQVTAEYTGNDYFYNNALGGTQSGFLIVKLAGKSKRIPVRVRVLSPEILRPPTYRGPVISPTYPYPLTPGLPPWCIPGMITMQPPIERIDEWGLPTEIVVKVNKFSCEGEFERQLQAPAGRALQHGNVVGLDSTDASESVSGNTLKIKVKQKKSKDAKGVEYCEVKSDSGSIKLWWTGALANQIKEVPVSIEEDEIPGTEDGRIMLYADAKEFTQSFDALEGAKCEGSTSHIKIKCSGAELKVSWDGKQAEKTTLKISRARDWNNRKIVVEATEKAVEAPEGVILKYFIDDKEFEFEGELRVPSTGKTTAEIFSDSGCKTSVGNFEVKKDAKTIPLAQTTIIKSEWDPANKDYYWLLKNVVDDSVKKTRCKVIVRKTSRQIEVEIPVGKRREEVSMEEGKKKEKAVVEEKKFKITAFKFAHFGTSDLKLSGKFEDPNQEWEEYSLELYSQATQKFEERTQLGSSPFSGKAEKIIVGPYRPPTAAEAKAGKPTSGEFTLTIDDASAIKKMKEAAGANIHVYAKLKAYDAKGNEIGWEITPKAEAGKAFVLSQIMRHTTGAEYCLSLETANECNSKDACVWRDKKAWWPRLVGAAVGAVAFSALCGIGVTAGVFSVGAATPASIALCVAGGAVGMHAGNWVGSLFKVNAINGCCPACVGCKSLKTGKQVRFWPVKIASTRKLMCGLSEANVREDEK